MVALLGHVWVELMEWQLDFSKDSAWEEKLVSMLAALLALLLDKKMES